VTLALYICAFFNLEPSMFAGVAAIFTIQPSIYRTWKQTLDQLLTNTIGAAIALFTIFFFGNDPFTIGVVMIIVILMSLKMKMENTISLTLVTVLAIMSAPGNEDVFYALNRFTLILIGIGSAFIVNIGVLPPKYKSHYMDKVQSIFQNLSLLLRTAISDEMTEKSFNEHANKLKDDLIKLEELFKIFDEERGKMSRVNPLDAREIVVFKQMLKSLQQGLEVLQVIGEHYFQSKTNEEESKLFDRQLEDLIKSHEHFLLKYQGKIKIEEYREEDEVIKYSELFLEQIMANQAQDGKRNVRLVVIACSIFEYAFQLERLNQLIGHYLKTKDN
jgi:uncharacterized membrane protein YgaE (UPF0421/DUF939 family)